MGVSVINESFLAGEQIKQLKSNFGLENKGLVLTDVATAVANISISACPSLFSMLTPDTETQSR